MTRPKKTPRPVSITAFVRSLDLGSLAGWSWCALAGTLLLISFLAGANFDTRHRLYVAGEIADSDVVADRDMLMEDQQATRARRRQVISLQPPVYDLSIEPYTQFQSRIVDILRALNNPNPAADPAIQRITDELTPQVAEEVLPELAAPAVQTYTLRTLLPQIHDQLAEGLVSDIRQARVGPAGMILRNLDNDTETLRPDVHTLPDVQSFLAELSAELRNSGQLNPQSRRAVNILLATTMPATLTPNLETTRKRSADAVAMVSPVYHQIQKGELLLRKGERVSREQQIKLQALYESAEQPVHWNVVAGAFFCSLILSLGFFLSPSGKPGASLRRKDIFVICIILLFVGVCAKAAYLFGQHMNSPSLLSSFAAAFPVAGSVGLGAMIFAARRYCTMGLLLSFFSTMMFHSGIAFFIYYFLGGMLATWLVTRAQSRQDVVWSVVPLVAGLLLIWVAGALLGGVPVIEFPIQATAVIINALLSLILLFAVSPVLEMAFGYSTRFRLMELMSLEQPLMQEIMVTIPGTYHHSLVVANMVEAGAKAIGANSLLCKVAALYHDAGKISYPEYFIENQFGAPNKHDKLAPSMSALILLSHVKKGTELAAKYKLGEEITDIIRQHHGTRQMRFFYQKALNLGEKPNESDYCYPGPRPQSKEAAILMLADSVEASSRTLSDPTPARVKNHIDNIIKGIFAEGQLDESELTFKDLHYLSENFQRILTGIFHQRIAYPESRIKAEQGKSRSEAPAGNSAQEPEKADKK